MLVIIMKLVKDLYGIGHGWYIDIDSVNEFKFIWEKHEKLIMNKA